MKMPATSGARRGSEKEEPKEPPLSHEESEGAYCIVSEPGGYVRIVGGAFLLSKVESEVKKPFYHYNSMISELGYYIKPVHKVYKRKYGDLLIYVYYGRYWFRRQGSRMIYAGVEKPVGIPWDPPVNPLEGTTLILNNNDLIINENMLDRFFRLVRNVIPELQLSYRRC